MEEAIAQLRRRISIDPSDDAATRALAGALLKLNSVDEAYQLLKTRGLDLEDGIAQEVGAMIAKDQASAVAATRLTRKRYAWRKKPAKPSHWEWLELRNFLAQSRPLLALQIPPEARSHRLHSLPQLQSLRGLDLERSDLIDAELAPIRSLRSLESLSLRNTSIDGTCLAGFSDLRSLKELDLTLSNVEGNAFLEFRPPETLETLSVATTMVEVRHFSAFSGHSALQDLNLEYVGLDQEDLEPIAKLPALRRLSLANNRIGEGQLAPLKALQNLEYICLDSTEIAVEDLTLLAALPKLNTVSLWNNDIDPDTARRALPQVTNIRT